MSSEAEKLFDRLVKCMELSASENDAEALLALRKANHLRKQMNLMWFDILMMPANAQVSDGDTDDYDYENVFNVIFEREDISEKWVTILESIHSYYKRVGRLTPKQHALVMKFYGGQ